MQSFVFQKFRVKSFGMRTSGTLEISTKMSIFSKIPQKMKIVHPSISMLESLSVASKTLGTSSLSVFTQKKSLVIFGYYQYFGISEHIFTTHVSKSSEKARCSGKNEYLHNIFTNCSPKSCCQLYSFVLVGRLRHPKGGSFAYRHLPSTTHSKTYPCTRSVDF